MKNKVIDFDAERFYNGNIVALSECPDENIRSIFANSKHAQLTRFNFYALKSERLRQEIKNYLK